ncbi:MAG: Gfo/Idh/MocA family protein [Thermoproteota archaeon]
MAARRNGVKLMVGHSFRYHPMILMSIKYLKELGQIYLVAKCKRQPKVEGWRLNKEESGGAIMDLGVHLFGLTEFVLEEKPKAVFCQTMHILSSDVEDFFVALLDFPGNVMTVLDASMSSNSRTDKMEFTGTEGQILADRYLREVQFLKGSSRHRIPMTGSDATIHLLLKDFIESILEDREPTITGEDGLEAVRVAEACYRSSKMNRKIAM